ncbi:hypothetical protein NLN92_18920 [Citrobacter portucalensis]|uniref:cell envelope integrity TolA C-terminal domain-containing protein n=1 Tax=Citrobacter portucalensis TaxID=1639133 RepID=UPI00226B21EA|nr:cell envelope integrity TolA C-terminal domain-containing protein [Citrobacter portucalensis]MCX8980079.1 hypothetical protein [Citrobacter portucalensis]
MKKILLIAVLTLSGCIHTPAHRIGDCEQSVTLKCAKEVGGTYHGKLFDEPAPVVAKITYGVAVGKAIRARLYAPEMYNGKSCTLRLKIDDKGVLQAVQSEGGDPAYCQALIAASKAAKFSVPPVGATGADHAIPTLDFKETTPRVTEVNEGL